MSFLSGPTGPLNRVADNSLARKLLGWQPEVPFREGLRRTIDWYFAEHDREQVSAALSAKLGEAETVKAVWKPRTTTPVDEESAQSLMKLVAALDEDNDVQNVFTNFEVSDEVMRKLTAA